VDSTAVKPYHTIMCSMAAAEVAPNPYSEQPFASVSQGLAAIDAAGPDHLSTETLCADVEWFAAQERALQACAARWLAAIDSRERETRPPQVPHGSCTLWLQDALQLSPGAASAQLRTARELEALPRVAAALRSGRIGYQHVTVICRAMEQVARTCLDGTELEGELVLAAEQMDPRQLHDHWLQLRYQADQEAGLAAEEDIAADLGDGGEAVRRAERVPAKLLPSFLAERRTFLLLGTARGHALCNDAASATTILLDAEQAAPEEIRHNPEARSLVFGLLSRSPERNEPLRALAARMSGGNTGETAIGLPQ
jgi:hypothetical protein